MRIDQGNEKLAALAFSSTSDGVGGWDIENQELQEELSNAEKTQQDTGLGLALFLWY